MRVRSLRASARQRLSPLRYYSDMKDMNFRSGFLSFTFAHNGSSYELLKELVFETQHLQLHDQWYSLKQLNEQGLLDLIQLLSVSQISLSTLIIDNICVRGSIYR